MLTKKVQSNNTAAAVVKKTESVISLSFSYQREQSLRWPCRAAAGEQYHWWAGTALDR